MCIAGVICTALDDGGHSKSPRERRYFVDNDALARENAEDRAGMRDTALNYPRSDSDGADNETLRENLHG